MLNQMTFAGFMLTLKKLDIFIVRSKNLR